MGEDTKLMKKLTPDQMEVIIKNWCMRFSIIPAELTPSGLQRWWGALNFTGSTISTSAYETPDSAIRASFETAKKIAWAGVLDVENIKHRT